MTACNKGEKVKSGRVGELDFMEGPQWCPQLRLNKTHVMGEKTTTVTYVYPDETGVKQK